MNPLTNKWGLFAIALSVLAIAGALVLVLIPAPKNNPSTNNSLSDLIVVDSPKPGATLTSTTLTITGKARGTWYFEASFPVVLTDWDGKIIAQGHAEAQGDWMTTEFVPFTATLTYTKPMGGDPSANRGFLILKNDNPSGDPAKDKSVEIPVYFK